MDVYCFGCKKRTKTTNPNLVIDTKKNKQIRGGCYECDMPKCGYVPKNFKISDYDDSSDSSYSDN